jgi:hypothetical protein
VEGRIERLGQGEKVASASAAVLFACMFLSWFNFGFDTENAWEALHFISPILLLTIVASLGIAFMKLTGRDLGDIPGGLVILVLGSLSAVLILFRLLDPVSLPGFEGGSTSASVEAGAFLGLIAAAGVAFGGYLATDSEALERLKRLVPSGGAPGAVPPPPPPPAPPAPPAPQSLPPLPPQGEPLTEPPAPAQESSVFCEGCGSPVRAADKFCGKCGRQQDTIAAS